MLNKDVIKEWVDALRSGEYEQGTNALKLHQVFDNAKNEYGEWVPLDKPQFCCLGVLCDLAEQKGITTGVPDERGSGVAFDQMTGLPPASVEDWAGVTAWEVTWPDDLPPKAIQPECSPECEVCAEEQPPAPSKIGLASLNDNHGYTFPRIADAIEKEWLNV